MASIKILKEKLLDFLDTLNDQYLFFELIFIKEWLEKQDENKIYNSFYIFLKNHEDNVYEILKNSKDDEICRFNYDIIIKYASEQRKEIKYDKLKYILEEIWFKNTEENKNILCIWIKGFLNIITSIRKKL